MEFFKSTGVLRYGWESLVLDIDQGIVDFYRSLIPKYIEMNRQKYAAHISVVRKEVPPYYSEFWRKHEGEVIEFEYSNYIYNGTVYWWLNAYSKRLEEIRSELGLSILDQFNEPFRNYSWTFHTTLGNIKNLD